MGRWGLQVTATAIASEGRESISKKSPLCRIRSFAKYVGHSWEGDADPLARRCT